MRLMYTTALASAVMFAGPALAAGDKVEGTTGMTQPESSAAQLPGQGADAGAMQQDFESAGFSDWRSARDLHIIRMQSGDGQPVWLVLMPRDTQVGAAEPGASGMDGESDLPESAGSALEQQGQPDASQQAQAEAGGQAGDMPQRGEQADISETFDEAEGSEQADISEAPDLGETAGEADIAEGSDLPDVGEAGGEADIAEGPDAGQAGDPGQTALDQPQGGQQLGADDQAGGQADIAEGPQPGEQGIQGQTEPEGFAAQIPGQLQSSLEDAGFQQVESIDDAEVFHTRADDGRVAFVIVGDLGASGFGAGGQQPADIDRPGATPDLPEPAPADQQDGQQGTGLPQ